MIDSLIQRANKINLYQDHWKLITTSLTNLKNKLNDRITLLEENCNFQKDFSKTLKLIDEVVTCFDDNGNSLNGIAYNDFESLLIRFHYQLAQYESQLENDYVMRVEILSKVYKEQQLLMQKSFIKKMEQDNKENMKTQLHRLQEKHSKIIESYFRCCIELHENEYRSDLSPDDVLGKVAHHFYQTSSGKQVLLQQQPFKIPIKRQFNRFKMDNSRIFEENESKRLKPIPYTLKDNDEVITDESFIQTKRWILILGDPLCGKTCFVRGLVHYLARNLLLSEQYSTEHGLLRLPILIQIREFAEILKEQPSLTLFDYIGKHHWIGKSIVDDPLISSEDLSSTFRDYIQQGQALIILDGLDEISLSDQRSKILNAIENFASTYVQIPIDASNYENIYLNRLLDDSSISGGNQLIVTSRQETSDTIPLNRQFTRFTIQPMNKDFIIEFVDDWFFHMHQCIIHMLNLPLVNQAMNHSEILKKQLETTTSADLLEMASNMGLLSLICTQSFNRVDDSAIPTQYFLQLELTLKCIIDVQHRKMPIFDLLQVTRILSEIAYFIQKKTGSNVITNQEITEICFQTINASKNRTSVTTNDIDDLTRQIVRIICNDIGILVPRDESLSGFLFTGFQKYFTCLKLIESNLFKASKKFIVDVSERNNQMQRIAQLLSVHAHDRRFRIPITLAFGKISSSWSPDNFNDLCYEFLQIQNDEYDSILPINAYILINSVDSFINFPSNEILFSALDCLIIAAGQHNWFTVCPFLLEEIANALEKFPRSIVSSWINKFLSESSRHDVRTISVFCQFLEGKPHEFHTIQWLDQSICSMLQSLLSIDNANNGFAVDRLLVKIAFSNPQLLPLSSITFRTFLLDKAIQIDSIPNELFPVIITLYGGLKRDGQLVLFDPTHIHRESTVLTPFLIRFFSEDAQNLKKLKKECISEFVKRMNEQDESLETIDLCIATICFYTIEYVQQNIKLISDLVLRACMYRLKYVSMSLRQFYFTADENDRSIEKETTKFISLCIEKFQYVGGARINFLNLLNSLKSSLARLRSSSQSILFEGISLPDKRATLHLPNCLRKEDRFLNGLLLNDLHFYCDRNSCSLIYHFNKLFWLLEHNYEFEVEHRMAVALETIPEYLLLPRDEDLLIPLTFIPAHLQNLYVRLLKENFIMIHPKGFRGNDRQHLYFGHIFVECLMFVSNASCKRLSRLAVLITLLPWFRMQSLENLGSSLLWGLSVKDSSYLYSFEEIKKRTINYETGQFLDTNENLFNGHYLDDEMRTKIIQNNIEEEYKRIKNVSTESSEKNRKLYAASISLAHVCRWIETERKATLLAESINGAMSIENKLARLDALCAIALFSYSNYDKIKIDSNRSLQTEIEYQFKEIHTNLPVLLQTAIFIRCLPLLQHSQVIDDCLRDIFSKLANTDKRDQEAIIEALLPYMELSCAFSSITNCFSSSTRERDTTIDSKSTTLKKYFNKDSSFSLSLSNLYLMELTNDLYECIKMDNYHFNIDQSIVTKLFQFDSGILTEAQALVITRLISCFTTSANQYEDFLILMNRALHRIHTVEFKACRLLESWLIWKDSNEFSCFAYHAALLLINSEFWSTEATEIVCDLLCNDSDRFRQRAETLLRSSSDDSIRTSSILGIDVLLTLVKKRVHYQPISIASYLTISRLLQSTTLDVQSHLEILLWLERYRIHALINKEYSLNKLRSSSNVYVKSFFSSDIGIDVCAYTDCFRFSYDLVMYLCDMIGSNFFTFLAIDEDAVSSTVSESHIRFVISIILSLHRNLNNTKETREMTITVLLNLFDTSDNNQIREVVAYLLGYVCDEETYKNLFNKIVYVVNSLTDDTSNYSVSVLSALISSYSYCVSRSKITFDQDDLDLFCMLLKHDSKDIMKAVRTGFGRVLTDRSFLLSMLSFDYSDCYHALIGATASYYLDNIQSSSEGAVVTFLEENSTLLSIFIVELFDHLRSFTAETSHTHFNYYERTYSYPTYLEVTTLVVALKPTKFINFIRDWHDVDNFKSALFNASKQNHFAERAACLKILSLLGELTVELCRLFIEAVRDDPYVQNNCYKCVTHIQSIKDREDVLNLLLSYLKSKSVTIRYITIKILLHLSSLSLIPFKQVHALLNDVMLDPGSNEDLWIINEGDSCWIPCEYYCAGPLKDVIYSLLLQQTIDHSSDHVQRDEFNDMDADFIESAKASRFASCTYEEKQTDSVE